MLSLTTELVETKRNMKNIHNMAKYECQVKVRRCGEIVEISSIELVPGDLLVIQNGKLPCDAFVVSGGCIVDEAMLTGESLPVIKDAISQTGRHVYNIEVDKRHSLYEGTFVIQTRGYGGDALAVVARTGFSTMKGRLVRTILFPKPNKFSFYRDSLKFVAVMSSFTVVGFALTIPFQIMQGSLPITIIIRCFELMTVTVPATLPVAMAAGTIFAIQRLRKNHRVFCISPPRINVAGKVGLMTFDKTGTLTEDGMDINGVQAIVDNRFSPITDHPQNLRRTGKHFLEAIASCHSLTIVNDVLIGDPQDLRLFQSTGWEFREGDLSQHSVIKAIVRQPEMTSPNVQNALDGSGQPMNDVWEPYEIGIIHTFHFESKLKRMGVIVQDLKSHNYRFFLKGAPEVVTERCILSSIPNDYQEVVQNYTIQGYRVLAYAAKQLPSFSQSDINTLELDQIDGDLEFLGLAILQNKLKPETIPSINRLQDAQIRTVMATGDALLTGISVGRECGIIGQDQDVYLGELVEDKIMWEKQVENEQHRWSFTGGSEEIPWLQVPYDSNYAIAMTGAAFMHMVAQAEAGEERPKALLKVIADKGQVFARMSPESKAKLVEYLQRTDVLVGMCGDGANDCGALKTADIGISLSEAEASIAAPFTSQIANISCTYKILADGRCAFATSLQCFKYLVLYSAIEFVAICILYMYAIYGSQFQWLWIDLVTALPVGLAMCYTGPLDYLSDKEINASLVSATVLSSVIGQVMWLFIAQATSILLLINQDFYSQVEIDPNNPQAGNVSYENTVIWLVQNFEMMTLAFICSVGKPWKRPAYSNNYLNVVVSSLSIFAIYFILYPADPIREFFGMMELPFYFRLILFAICIGYALAAYLYEHYVVAIIDKRTRRRESLHKYQLKVDDYNLALAK